MRILYRRTINSKIKKCKCGNKAYIAKRDDLYFVKCTNCGRECKPFPFDIQAIERWNENRSYD